MNKIGTCSCEKTRMFEKKIQIQGEGYHAKTHIKSYMERITHGWKWPHGTRQRCISRTILGRFTIRIGGRYESRRIDCGSSCRLFFHGFLTNSWKRGFTPDAIETSSTVTIERQGEGYTITMIELDVEGSVPDIEEEKFIELAEMAKNG